MQYLTDYNVQLTAFVALFFSLWCVLWVMPKFGIAAGALLGYMGLNSIWFSFWKDNRYLPVNAYDQMAIRYFAADSLLKALLILVPLMLAADRDIYGYRRAGKIIALLVCVSNSALIIISYLLGFCSEPNTCGGFIGNPSLSVSMMVCALPFFSKRLPIIALVALAVLCSKSSVGLGLLGAFALLALPGRKWVAALAVAALGVFGYWLLGSDLWFSSGRFPVWKTMMHAWNAPQNIAFGTGWGTYHVFSIHIQDRAHLGPGNWWNWLHNDWLQLLFEGGVVGAFLAVTTYTVAVLKAALKPLFLERPQPCVLRALILYGLFMVFNPALHYPFPMMFGAWLFVLALYRKPLQFA